MFVRRRVIGPGIVDQIDESRIQFIENDTVLLGLDRGIELILETTGNAEDI